MNDPIERQDAIDAIDKRANKAERQSDFWEGLIIARSIVDELPSAQPEVIRCKDCEYGKQDEIGRWFCRSLGCQIGNEDGSGFCADAERRINE